MSLAERALAAAFAPERCRTPRSEPYRQGVRAGLERRLEGRRLAPPYHPGTAEADAWAAGLDEGLALARLLQAGETPCNGAGDDGGGRS